VDFWWFLASLAKVLHFCYKSLPAAFIFDEIKLFLVFLFTSVILGHHYWYTPALYQNDKDPDSFLADRLVIFTARQHSLLCRALY